MSTKSLRDDSSIMRIDMKVSRLVTPADKSSATSCERSLHGGLKVRRKEASSFAKVGSKDSEGGKEFGRCEGSGAATTLEKSSELQWTM